MSEQSPKRRATEAESAVIEEQEEMSRARDNLGYVCSQEDDDIVIRLRNQNSTSFTS